MGILFEASGWCFSTTWAKGVVWALACLGGRAKTFFIGHYFIQLNDRHEQLWLTFFLHIYLMKSRNQLATKV